MTPTNRNRSLSHLETTTPLQARPCRLTPFHGPCQLESFNALHPAIPAVEVVLCPRRELHARERFVWRREHSMAAFQEILIARLHSNGVHEECATPTGDIRYREILQRIERDVVAELDELRARRITERAERERSVESTSHNHVKPISGTGWPLRRDTNGVLSACYNSWWLPNDQERPPIIPETECYGQR